ncbi:FAD-dependent monooxygenase [Burkholderiaceae bacterium UC74_6]
MQTYDVLVRGNGCVGRALALALGAQGLRVALLGLPSSGGAAAAVEDVRTYALNAASIALLKELKVWDSLAADAVTPVFDMQVMGDQPGSRLDFSSWSQGVSQLAHIVDAAELERQLAAALRFSPHVKLVDSAVPAALTALCEGRDSAGRAERGVRFEPRNYGQRAIAARLIAAEPHQGVARQWFRGADVLALLPFDRPQQCASYGLVWSLPDARAAELLALEPEAFELELSAAAGGLPLKLASGRAAWPLQLARAEPLLGPGWVLLGDAAHTIHPLAGQGLNLGLADVAALARVIRERESWRPLGDERLLRRYERDRVAATWAMGELTDGLQRLFATDNAALRELRNRGLAALNALPPLKRWLTGQALGV